MSDKQTPAITVGTINYGPHAGKACTCTTEDFRTHAAVFGMTGSGKTVCIKTICETALALGVNVLVIDIKGDLSAMAANVISKEECTAVFGNSAHYDKLVENGTIDQARVLREKVERYIYTPLNNAGTRLSLTPLRGRPKNYDKVKIEDPALISMLANQAAATLLFMAGLHPDKKIIEVGFVTEIIKYCWDSGINLRGSEGINILLKMIETPPIQEAGFLHVDSILSTGARTSLLQRVNALLMGVEAENHEGMCLDVGRMLTPKTPGKAVLACVSMASVKATAQFPYIVANICNSVIDYMRNKTASAKKLNTLIVLDEMAGDGGKGSLFPDARFSSPSKSSISYLLRQGRSFGVGMLMGTQCIADIDYRGLANIGTKFVGQLQTPQDRKKFLSILDQQSDSSLDALNDLLAQVPAGTMFGSGKKGGWCRFKLNWLATPHDNIHPHQILRLAELGIIETANVSQSEETSVVDEVLKEIHCQLALTRRLTQIGIALDIPNMPRMDTGIERALKFLQSMSGNPFEVICPKCKTGSLLVRNGSNGKFYGCSNYPECRFSCNHLLELNPPHCQRCEAPMVYKRESEIWWCPNFKTNQCPIIPDCHIHKAPPARLGKLAVCNPG